MTSTHLYDNERDASQTAPSPEELNELEELEELERFDSGFMTVEESARFLANLCVDKEKSQMVSDMLDLGLLGSPEEDDSPKDDPAPRPRGTMNPRVKKWAPTVAAAVCVLCVLGGLAVFFKNPDNPVVIVDDPTSENVAHVSTPGSSGDADTRLAQNDASSSSGLASLDKKDRNLESQSVEPSDTTLSLAKIKEENDRRNTNQNVVKDEARMREIVSNFDPSSSSSSTIWRKISELLDLGGFQEARDAWNSLKQPLKDSFDGRTCNGILLYFEGKLDEAEQALDEARQMNRNAPVASENLEIVKDAIETTRNPANQSVNY